jgi:RimJ/RimL family protein N-acetyltransferase
MTVTLGALNWEVAEYARHWRNDPRIMRWCRQTDFISEAEQEAWFKRQSEDPSIRMYAVKVDHPDGYDVIGVCGLTSIDWTARRAEFSLYIEPDSQKLGHGRDALLALFDHGFNGLNLNQIWGEVLIGNPALNLFDDLGMKRDGVRRDFYFKDGQYTDCVLISILREEWNGKEKD